MMRLATALIAIFAARFLMAALHYQGQDGDLAWQQWLGNVILTTHQIPRALGNETFTAVGAAWIPQEWLFSVAVALAVQLHAFSWLAIATTIAAAGALVLTAYRAYLRSATSVPMLLVVAFTGIAMLQSFGVRAQIFGWFFLALLMLLLEVESDWSYLAILVVALWANVHASALLAPAIVAAWTIGAWIEDRAFSHRVQRYALITAGCALAACATPFLWQLPIYAFSLETSFIRTIISEWQPPDITFIDVSAGLLPLLALCVYFGVAAPRERWRDGMVLGLAVFMSAIAVRHVPLAALLIAPMAAQRLSSALPKQARINAVVEESASQALIFLASGAVCAILVLVLARSPQITGTLLPRTAIATLARLPGTHNLYCEDFAWCSLALEEPNLRTFLDGRCDPFPQRIWKQYVAVYGIKPTWQAILDDEHVDSVLAAQGRPLADMLAVQRDWRLVYHDRRYDLFLRDGVRTAER